MLARSQILSAVPGSGSPDSTPIEEQLPREGQSSLNIHRGTREPSGIQIIDSLGYHLSKNALFRALTHHDRVPEDLHRTRHR